MYFDFTKKPNFEELEKKDDLLYYIGSLEKNIMEVEHFMNIYIKDILNEKTDNIGKYKTIFLQKRLDKYKQELKAMKERETELNEYLEEVVKKPRNDLNI